MSSATITFVDAGGNLPLFPANKPNPHSTGFNPDVMAALHPSPSMPEKNAQGSSNESQGVYWECYPHLTEKLLSWLWDNLADHVVLFNEKKDTNTQGTSAKPHGQCKKDINAVIAHIVFHDDVVYGEIYANSAEKFTSAGIDPNDSNHQTLQEKIHAESLFWEDCHQIWHGNPAYSTKAFNAAPGTNQVEHFLSIANDCTSLMSAASTQPSGQVQSNDQHDMVGKHGRDIPLGGAAQLEEEEPECNDVEHNAEMSGGLQDWQDGPLASDQLPVNVMLPMSTSTTSLSTPLSGDFSPDMTSKTLHMVFKGKGKSGFTSIKASLDNKLVSLNNNATES
ncbi:hypothetical protein V8B97DRAFT_2024224 [Scleroderma yunnanense]